MDRYSRQLLYKNIDETSQKKLLKAEICIVGIGALGTIATELLARAGVGRLVLIDRDFVELNNLQRQVLFDEQDIGKAKAETAAEKIHRINKNVIVRAINQDMNPETVNLIGAPDIILGCTDNLESRYLINDYAIKHGLPWIYGAAVADRGMVFNILPGGPCLRCILGYSDDTCDTIGILNTVSAVVGSIMANEAIKIIIDAPYEKKLIHLNLWNNEFNKIKVNQDSKCPACKGNFEYLLGKKTVKSIKLCGKGMYQFSGIKHNFHEKHLRFKKLGKVILFNKLLHFKNITLFEDGRVLIKAETEQAARQIYSRYLGH